MQKNKNLTSKLYGKASPLTPSQRKLWPKGETQSTSTKPPDLTREYAGSNFKFGSGAKGNKFVIKLLIYPKQSKQSKDISKVVQNLFLEIVK